MVDETLLSILVCPADRGPLLLVDEATDIGDDEHAQLMARATPANPQ